MSQFWNALRVLWHPSRGQPVSASPPPASGQACDNFSWLSQQNGCCVSVSELWWPESPIRSLSHHITNPAPTSPRAKGKPAHPEARRGAPGTVQAFAPLSPGTKLEQTNLRKLPVPGCWATPSLQVLPAETLQVMEQTKCPYCSKSWCTESVSLVRWCFKPRFWVDFRAAIVTGTNISRVLDTPNCFPGSVQQSGLPPAAGESSHPTALYPHWHTSGFLSDF